MAIALSNTKYNLIIDSNMIIGVIGKDYDKFLLSLAGDNIFYLDKEFSVSNKIISSLIDIDDKIINLIKEFNLGEELFNKRVNQLSHSEKKLLKYLLMIKSNKKIIVIDEPFMDLDYYNKKKITLLLNKLIKDKKTIIIGSVDSNIVYSLCKKVLFINEDNYYYGNINLMENKKLLNKYHVAMPDIVKFISLVKEKNIKLNYSKDIRDLIKDVYRNVSQK